MTDDEQKREVVRAVSTRQQGPRRSGRRRFRAAQATLLVGVLASLGLLAGCGSSATTSDDTQTRTIRDVAGREVEIPQVVDEVVTVGTIPMVNDLVLVVGEGKSIMNSMSTDYVDGYPNYGFLAPNLMDAPAVEDTIMGPIKSEVLLKLQPDLVLASNEELAAEAEKLGVPALVVDIVFPEGTRKSVSLLGEVFGQEERADDYLAYLDEVNDRLRTIGEKVPQADRGKPSTLYMTLDPPVRRNGQTLDFGAELLNAEAVAAREEKGRYTFEVEQILTWDPEIIFAEYRSDKERLMTDKRFKDLRAVKNDQVHIVPFGADLWAEHNTEGPLGLLWEAKIVRPELTQDLDVGQEVTSFYERFFDVRIDDEQLETILQGGNP